MSAIVRLEVPQNLDQMGEPEEFTWDIPFLAEMSHLSQDGLPQIGSCIKPGMVIVAKLGRTKKYDRHKINSCFEILASVQKLRTMYQLMLYDASLYATPKTSGIVKTAYFERISTDLMKAVVEIEADN